MSKSCILWENVPMKNQWISSLSLKCESCLLVALACKLSVSFRMKKDLIWRINASQKTGTSCSHLLELLSSFASYQFMRVYNWTFKWTAFTLQKKWSFPLTLECIMSQNGQTHLKGLRTSSSNVIKFGVSCGFDHIYWRNT